MPRFNTTLQQYSPLIVYNGAWRPGNPRADPYWPDYNDGFDGTEEDGASLVFTFTGTGVWLYGGKRENHGLYTVTFDGQSEELDGGSETETVQQILFSSFELPNESHTLEVVNHVVGNRTWFDVDYIIFEAEAERLEGVDTIEGYDPRWKLSDGWSAIDDVDAQGGDILTSVDPGSEMELEFEGDNILLYGTISPNNGRFQASVDGVEDSRRDVNTTYHELRRRALLYQATSLGPGSHVLRITNQDSPTSSLIEIDFAEIRGRTSPQGTISTTGSSVPTGSPGPSVISTTPSSKSSSTGAIVGGVIGGLVFLSLIVLFLLWKRRQRKRQTEIDQTIATPHPGLQSPTFSNFLVKEQHPSSSSTSTPYNIPQNGSPMIEPSLQQNTLTRGSASLVMQKPYSSTHSIGVSQSPTMPSLMHDLPHSSASSAYPLLSRPELGSSTPGSGPETPQITSNFRTSPPFKRSFSPSDRLSSEREGMDQETLSQLRAETASPVSTTYMPPPNYWQAIRQED